MSEMINAGFSDELNAFIDEWKSKPGNLIMILHKVQEEQGYISKEAAIEVAKRTNSHLARVYGVMSFYHFFKTQRPGKNMISVCLGTACYLKGGQDIIDEAKSILGLTDDKISTDDGMFSVEHQLTPLQDLLLHFQLLSQPLLLQHRSSLLRRFL